MPGIDAEGGDKILQVLDGEIVEEATKRVFQDSRSRKFHKRGGIETNRERRESSGGLIRELIRGIPILIVAP
jgi:hypothetical protein